MLVLMLVGMDMPTRMTVRTCNFTTQFFHYKEQGRLSIGVIRAGDFIRLNSYRTILKDSARNVVTHD